MSSKPTSQKQTDMTQAMIVSDVVSVSHIGGILREMGINPEAVNVPVISHHEKVDWETLCNNDTRDRSTRVSDVVVVTLVSANLDIAQEFQDYKGMVRIEFVTQHGEKLFVSHAMTYAATGEATPLYGWVAQQTVPFAMRFGRIETRKRNQYVIRPMPIDIETV